MQLSFGANPASQKSLLTDSTILMSDVNSPFSGFGQKFFLTAISSTICGVSGVFPITATLQSDIHS